MASDFVQELFWSWVLALAWGWGPGFAAPRPGPRLACFSSPDLCQLLCVLLAPLTRPTCLRPPLAWKLDPGPGALGRPLAGCIRPWYLAQAAGQATEGAADSKAQRARPQASEGHGGKGGGGGRKALAVEEQVEEWRREEVRGER